MYFFFLLFFSLLSFRLRIVYCSQCMRAGSMMITKRQMKMQIQQRNVIEDRSSIRRCPACLQKPGIPEVGSLQLYYSVVVVDWFPGILQACWAPGPIAGTQWRIKCYGGECGLLRSLWAHQQPIVSAINAAAAAIIALNLPSLIQSWKAQTIHLIST